jgi:two-component system, response regulator, stage 0 sporulation protein F
LSRSSNELWRDNLGRRGERMNKLDVVIIDDDDGILWLMEEILSDNYSYQTCKSGLTGLKSIEKYQPRLAILDLKLGGGMNGLDVARKIPEKSSQTRIIFLTGYIKTVLENLDKDLPILRVIEKPFDIEDLMNTISNFLKRNKKEDIFQQLTYQKYLDLHL